MPPDIWLPGYERWELPGVPGLPFDQPDNPKALLHSTEGSSIPGAVEAYKQYPPQLCVDPVRRRKVQHISLTRGGYALWNQDADDSRAFQVEIVGFAARMHELDEATLKWLGEEVLLPLHEYGGVPLVVVPRGFRRDGEMPYALADDASPLRLTQAEFDAFSGILGHQHVPGDDHWDPGGLRVDKMSGYARSRIAARNTPNPETTIRPRRREQTMIFTVKVTDSRHATFKSPMGAIVDPDNALVIGVAAGENLAAGSKEGQVPSYGVSGAELADLVAKYDAIRRERAGG